MQNIGGEVAFFVRSPEVATKLKSKTIVHLNDTPVQQFLYSPLSCIWLDDNLNADNQPIQSGRAEDE